MANAKLVYKKKFAGFPKFLVIECLHNLHNFLAFYISDIYEVFIFDQQFKRVRKILDKVLS